MEQRWEIVPCLVIVDTPSWERFVTLDIVVRRQVDSNWWVGEMTVDLVYSNWWAGEMTVDLWSDR